MSDVARPALARPLAQDRAKHIVDVLIEERAPRLSASPFWPLLRPPLYQILNYAKARRMADDIAPRGGVDALDSISALLRLNVETVGIENARRNGAFLILANHPTGITDGIALYDAVKPIRPDLLFYANSDAHRVCAQFDDVLIPVEWVMHKRTRERTRLTLKMTAEAFEAGKPLMIFPAGRLARERNGLVVDPEWQTSALSLARKYQLPIVPVHVTGPYATLFHLFDKFSPELRDITLFHELLNKHGKTYRLIFGTAIGPEAIVAAGDSTAASRRVKYFIERVLANDPKAQFDPAGSECPYRDPPKPGEPAKVDQ
ncbi:MAG: 1-acyl-sn-glycerol-3-phosphate acyltransferase [Caulobacterales bacterium]|jgi:putative hemolysin